MQRTMLFLISGLAVMVAMTSLGFAQQPNQPQTGKPATAQPRPDVTHSKPANQSKQPFKAAAKKSSNSAQGMGTPEARGPRTTDQSAPAQAVAKQKSYQGSFGKKADPGTACSTARPTPNGGVDCGTGGEGATHGKVPK